MGGTKVYKVGICDDNIAFGSQMEKYLEEYPKREAIPLDIVIFGSGSGYLKYLQAEAPIDILFLDIELEEKINGIFVGKKIRMDLRNEITQIVYVSALEEYAIQLFQNRPMDFLIKPIKQEDIDKIMNNYIHVFGKKEKHVFEYRVGKNQYRIGYDDIIYFQSTGRKVEIVTYDKRIDFYSSMDEIEKQLNKEIFWRIHKSYIINNRYIKEFSATEIGLENAIKLPISRTYREEIKKKILQDKMQRRG